MKKLKLLALGLLSSSVMLTSCADDNEENPIGPSLSVTEDTQGATNGEVDIAVGSTFSFSWDARKGDADMDMFTIEIDGVPIAETTDGGNTLPYELSGSDEDLYTDGITFTASAVSSRDYTFIVEDKDGMTVSRTITVNVVAGTTPLASAEAFTWQRVSGAAGTGLDQFGLKWTNNSSTSAIVMTESGSKMVNLNASAWSSITTKEALMAAVDGGTALSQYTGVSVQQSGTYDDVLGVKKTDGTYYLIHITDGTVTNTGGGNFTYKIEGDYKK